MAQRGSPGAPAAGSRRCWSAQAFARRRRHRHRAPAFRSSSAPAKHHDRFRSSTGPARGRAPGCSSRRSRYKNRDLGRRLGGRGRDARALEPRPEGLAGEFRPLLFARDAEHLLHHRALDGTAAGPVGELGNPCCRAFPAGLDCRASSSASRGRDRGPRLRERAASGAGSQVGTRGRRAAYGGIAPRTAYSRNTGPPHAFSAPRSRQRTSPSPRSSAPNSSGNDGHRLKHSRQPCADVEDALDFLCRAPRAPSTWARWDCR